MTEDEAVRAIGSVDEVAARILEDAPLVTLARERVRCHKPLPAANASFAPPPAIFKSR